MNASQENIPELRLTDSSLEAGWKYTDGWNGLIPEQGLLDEVIARLGLSCGESRLANATTYDFMNSGVRVTFRDGKTALSHIALYPEKLAPDMAPKQISEAFEIFGKFVITDMDPRQGTIYERPGMRIRIESTAPEEPIKSIEIFQPQD